MHVEATISPGSIVRATPRLSDRLKAFCHGRPAWLVLFVGAVILIYRRSGQIRNPQFFAEDGIFYTQTYFEGWRTAVTEVAGYLQSTPRIIAGIARVFDPSWAPHIFVGSALVLTLYTLSRVLSPRCPLPLRGLCALAIVLVPGDTEVLLYTSNIQWVLVAAFLLLLISAEPNRLTQRIHDIAAAIVLGLTGPFSLLLAPFFVWRAVTRRTPFSQGLAAVVVLCAIVQLINVIRHPLLPPVDASLDGPSLLAIAGRRIAGELLLGPFLTANLPWGVAVALSVAVFGGIAALSFVPRERDNWRVVLGLAFLALFGSTVYRCWHSLPAISAPTAATRYFFTLQLIVLWLLVAFVASRRGIARGVAVILTVWIVVMNFPRLRLAALPDMRWADYAPKLRAGEAVTIPINPPGWTFSFPARSKAATRDQ